MNLMQHIRRQKKFSLKIFGPGTRSEGILDHIRKELKEIEETPYDLEEWVDVILLALDGAWRTGNSPKEICQAILDKQEKNEKRSWPDWKIAKFGKAIEHIKEN